MKLNMAAAMTARPLIAFVLAASFAICPAFAKETEKSKCFNFESLSPELREKSEAYLLEALDTEHLYTIASGIKPMSAGFRSVQVPATAPHITEAEANSIIAELGDKEESELGEGEAYRLGMARKFVERAHSLREVEELRAILPTWRCGGEIYADLVHYATPHGGNRFLQGVIFALPSLRQVLTEKEKFFSRWALTPNASPLEVLMAVEYSRDVSRFAGYGYLFGYPDDAVRFFTSASASEDATGSFVERDFRAIPTFQRETGQFTYAVAKGAAESDIDRALRARAGAILDAYKLRRSQYIGRGKPGAAALLRDWFCQSDDHCSPANIPL